MRVEAVFVGSELLEGKLNTHAVELARRLAPLGLALARTSTVSDETAEIETAVRESLGRGATVLVSGGLGPTFDDLSREGLAAALGRKLEFRPELFRDIRAKFAARRLPMSPENRRQAFLVEGGRALVNDRGSAPGQAVEAGQGRTVYLLPGPGSELFPMFERSVLPALEKAAGGRPKARFECHCGGLIESQADHRLRPILKQYPNAAFTILASRGIVSFYATAPAPKDLRGLDAKVREALGAHIFGEGPTTLGAAVGKLLVRKKLKLAAAESCTGGLFGKMVTETPGSSRYFVGGLVAYSNRLKEAELGVPRRVLEKEGAVSASCAEAMAEGARRRYGADWAVSITGVAGPDGGTKAKPVGTVFVALAGRKGARSHLYDFNGDRHEVRHKAAVAALFRLWLAIL